MKIVPLSKLQEIDFAFSDISVTYRSPQWNTMGSLSGSGRTVNGFLLVDKGHCHYDWVGGNTDLSHGGLIYLAKESNKVITVTERPFSYYNINFTLTDTADGEQIIFDTNPLLITHSVSKNIFDICNSMISATMTKSGIFKSTSYLCELFDIIIKFYTDKPKTKISPAIEYIHSNYTETIDIPNLSNLCYLSQSQFFRAFKNQTGLTPLQYQNNLRLERAKALLSDNECSIGEVSEILGFESIYYFSRFFKKHTGIPPSEYQP